MEPRTLNALLDRLLRRGVELRTMTRMLGWTGGTARTELVYGGRSIDVESGAVVVAHGRTASPPPPPGPTPTYVIGDALAPRRITHAMLEGARFGAAL